MEILNVKIQTYFTKSHHFPDDDFYDENVLI